MNCLQKSRSNKQFEQYFDIYVIGKCRNNECSDNRCPFYSKLPVQRMELDISNCRTRGNEICLEFIPQKERIMFKFVREKDSNNKTHTTKIELYIINRYNRKCEKKKILNNYIYWQRHKPTLLSVKQRRFLGKSIWNDENKYLQEVPFKPVIGHSYAKNTHRYNKQLAYEIRIKSDKKSYLNLKSINVSEFTNLHR